MKRCLIVFACILTLGTVRGFAAGMLIPKDESIPPLAIESQRVDIQIKDGVATAKIEQVFRNSVNQNRVFPVPANGLQKIELEYSQTLAYDAGLYTYVYPLKTARGLPPGASHFWRSSSLIAAE